MTMNLIPEKQRVVLQLERLRRHHKHAAQTYDVASLWDLSHSLRMWAEMKLHLRDISPRFSAAKFRSSSPAKRAWRMVRPQRHVLAYMPDGAFTHAAQEEICGLATESGIGVGDQDFFVMTYARLTMPVSEVRQYVAMAAAPTDGDEDGVLTMKTLGLETTAQLNFIDWLGAPAVWLSYQSPDGGARKTLTLSRETLVKRMANSFDGSHPSGGAGSTEDVENRFDEPVRYLFSHRVLGLPLPYFLLIKIAQDITSTADKHLSAEGLG